MHICVCVYIYIYVSCYHIRISYLLVVIYCVFVIVVICSTEGAGAVGGQAGARAADRPPHPRGLGEPAILE